MLVADSVRASARDDVNHPLAVKAAFQEDADS